MEQYIYSIVIVLLLFVCLNGHVAMYVSHLLNNLFNLPHPGPNDIQGSCWCRRKEGPHKYTFKDFLLQNIKED
jgi:hypothetical protein